MTPKIFERIYIELKKEVTSGQYMPGQRLQARSLADTLRTSTSPITQAMRQLIGEQVLEYSEHDGFIVPRVTERRLRDLIQWSASLTRTSLAGSMPASEHWPSLNQATDTVALAEAVLRSVVALGQNAEFSHAINNTNDRLRATRYLEPVIVPDVADELDDLTKIWRAQDVTRLSQALGQYHDRRLAVVSQLVGLSYQDRS